MLDEETAADGYDQIPDTGWWEGEPGKALEIGERTYRPVAPQASLTLAAVFGTGRRPCYWLTSTTGNIIESMAGAERMIDELLLSAEQGGQIGTPAILVGRLIAPSTPAHSLKPKLKQEAARFSRLKFEHLGYLLAIYQQHEGLNDAELARKLGCSFEALDDLSLCLRPERNEEDGIAFRRYARLAADVAGVPVHLLGPVVRDALRFEREEQAITQQDGESGSASLA